MLLFILAFGPLRHGRNFNFAREQVLNFSVARILVCGFVRGGR